MSINDSPTHGPALNRRRFLALAGGLAGVVALERPGDALARLPRSMSRRAPAQAAPFQLTASPTTIDLAGMKAKTWAYNNMVPGPLLRVRAGETVRARVTNQLGDETSVHWHGIALVNAMDGVPGVTQPPIAKGASFDYEFVAPHPGTYFFHPHVGLQLDRGLYAPLIVDDPAEPGGYDAEWIIVLDDWTDGIGPSPAKIVARLRKGTGMDMSGSGMDMSGSSMPNTKGSKSSGMGSMMSDALGGMAGDVAYPLYFINGRPPKDPASFRAKAGQRVRLRLINAGSDTAFRFAIGGHRLTVTHADGFPVQPVETDAVLLGMGERIDVIVTCKGGANPVVARAEGKGKGKEARAVLRTGTGSIGRWTVPQLDRRLVTVADLVPAASVALAPRTPDRTHPFVLGGNDMTYQWTINAKPYDPTTRYDIAAGERVRLEFKNTSTMWHPMHLHGHTFAVMKDGVPGVRKDTVAVKPGETINVDFDADNPGAWMLHCHNTYHLEAGMMTTLRYV